MGCQTIEQKTKFSLLISYQDDISFSRLSIRNQSTLF